MSELAIGIDLGTTYSCVGIYQKGKVEIIANEQGNRTTPSYVGFTDEDRLIGDSAKNQVNRNPKNTIFDTKRLIGRKFSDQSVQQDMKHWSFSVIPNENNKPIISTYFNNKEYKFTPEEISSMILVKMKEIADNYLGKKVKNAVVTVPAYFNDAQRRATQDAGKIAGLNVLRIINEPTAAAIAYGLDKTDEKNILVFDLGGGTFDVSLLTIDDGLFEVKATAGDTHLGGEDFDNKLVVWCIKEFKRKNKTVNIQDLLNNKKVLRRLRTECERAKRSLSSTSNVWIDVDSLYEGIDFRVQITRAKFEDLCNEYFKKCITPVQKVLEDSGLLKDEIDEIVLVGGSTRIPKIRSMLKEYFGKEPKTDINPDEAVAYGASIQAAILSNVKDDKLKQLVLLDVAPLSLGIETSGGLMANLIDRNTVIPVTRESTFSTYSDNQPDVTINVYEGERKFTENNNLLGTFTLTDIPPMSRGTPKIKVKFNINANGILQVTATEESTRVTKKITIENDDNRFTADQINKMIESAEKMADEDKMRKDKLEAINDLKNYIYNIRNTIDNPEFINRMSEDKYKLLSEIIIEGKQWLENNITMNKNDYVIKKKNLEEKIKPLMSSVYEKN